MPWAAFPAAGYVSASTRTEGEMKTAFENWLDACKDTRGHGQCRLVYQSPTNLVLAPWNGNQLIVQTDSYQVPVGGVYFPNSFSGSQANIGYLLTVFASGTTLVANAFGWRNFGTTNDPSYESFEPTTGVYIPNYSGAAHNEYTIVGLATLNASAQWSPAGTISWFNRLPTTSAGALSIASTSSTSPITLVTLNVPAFSNDIVTAILDVNLQASTPTRVSFQYYLNGTYQGQITADLGVQGWYSIPIVLDYSGYTAVKTVRFDFQIIGAVSTVTFAQVSWRLQRAA
jgi:hypothetical protein